MDEPRVFPSLAFAVLGGVLSIADYPAIGLMCTMAAVWVGFPPEDRR